jgi:hypothetical protein
MGVSPIIGDARMGYWLDTHEKRDQENVFAWHEACKKTVYTP